MDHIHRPTLMKIRLFAISLICMAAIFSVNVARAAPVVVITNTPNGSPGGTRLSNTIWKSLQFSTSSSPSEITSIQLGLNGVSGAYPTTKNITIALYTVSGNYPDTQLYSLMPQAVSMTASYGIYEFTIPVSQRWRLQPNTQYALVLSSDIFEIKWGYSDTSGPGQTEPTGLNGFSYLSFANSFDSGANWSPGLVPYNTVVISAEIAQSVPTLSICSYLILGLLVSSASAWYMRRIKT